MSLITHSLKEELRVRCFSNGEVKETAHEMRYKAEDKLRNNSIAFQAIKYIASIEFEILHTKKDYFDLSLIETPAEKLFRFNSIMFYTGIKAEINRSIITENNAALLKSDKERFFNSMWKEKLEKLKTEAENSNISQEARLKYIAEINEIQSQMLEKQIQDQKRMDECVFPIGLSSQTIGSSFIVTP